MALALIANLNRTLRKPLVSMVADAVCQTYWLDEAVTGVYSARGTAITSRRLATRARSQQGLVGTRRRLSRALLRWRSASESERKDAKESLMLIKDVALHLYGVAQAALAEARPNSTLECREVVAQALLTVLDAAPFRNLALPLQQLAVYLTQLRESHVRRLEAAAERKAKEFERWGIIEPSVLKK
jgi:hypothetical protein